MVARELAKGSPPPELFRLTLRVSVRGMACRAILTYVRGGEAMPEAYGSGEPAPTEALRNGGSWSLKLESESGNFPFVNSNSEL